jgi:2-dehydropantoate 2-reductase
MRVLLFGTGGVGSIYAYILHQGSALVTTVCRSNYEAVFSHGITIDSALFGKVNFCPSHVVKTVAEAASLSKEPYDYVVVCSKWFPNQAHLIQPAVTAGNTTILLCQNGISIEPEYANAYPSNVILSGVVYLPTTQNKPGYITMGPLQKLQIGPYPSSSDPDSKAMKAASTFVTVYKQGGGIIEIHPDIQPSRFLKLAVNVAWNPICALTRCDDANFLRSTPISEHVIRSTMWEISQLSSTFAWVSGKNAAEYTISPEAISQQLIRQKERLETGGKEPSMLTDVRENRPLEVEAILGNAVRMAQELKLELPRLEMLYALAGALSYSIAPDERWKPLGM